MGKSPGKWIKTVFFGKKTTRSNLSKDATSEIKTSVVNMPPSNDVGADSMVISSPVRPVIASSEEHIELEKSSSANLLPDTTEYVAASGEELIKLEQAATKAQAAFRGYLARRAFWALKGIIRLQALVRGHLVRRQAVATLSCMRAIVEFQALVRGRSVRLSNTRVLQKHTTRGSVDTKSTNLLGTSLRVEKLSTNVFATKLVASSYTTMPLSLQYESVDPNSARSWLERWSSSSFWEPLLQPKKTLDPKPKRKQTKLQIEETEIGRPKRSVRKLPAANIDTGLSNSSENEKSRRTVRKASHQADVGQDQSVSELEKVKRNLRKISISTKSETEAGKSSPNLIKEISEEVTNHGSEKINGSYIDSVKQPEPEPEPEEHRVQPKQDKPLEVVQDDQAPVEPTPLETNGKLEDEPPAKVEVNVKENQKTRRRKSLPAAKQEQHEIVSQNTPTLPSYMAATESAKAKLRAQAAAKAAEEGVVENGVPRRLSLPSVTAKTKLQSPRVQKSVQANGKGGSKPNKSQISPRDEKVVQGGWKR
ncbi:protein IQ-DOMAIN 31-like [Rutidosis leptorrhynchoides]|uniref:protein IQ-DOMAIN 31-like n=1 Tax=Rutidosis leptorrhynchoides TaxID=125765 RepID=UPI003A9A1C1B